MHIEPGWTRDELPDMFVRIGRLISGSLKDLFPGQVFQSSTDIIDRAAIGTMALAWYEHDQYHTAAGRRPEDYGFNGSFKVLVRMLPPTDRQDVGGDRRGPPPPNPWQIAAGRVCNQLRGMSEMAHQLLYETPAQVRTNLSQVENRALPPLNKLGPMVYSDRAARQFVDHPERLSLGSVLAAHDILIVNPRKDRLGRDGPEILVNFMIHMLDQVMNEHLAWDADTRPRVSLVIDEAHTLITPDLMRMIAEHREAGFSVACATQYMSQIGANLEGAERDYVRDGVENLLQTKMFGRMSSSADAEAAASLLRAVWESLTRSDPVSQARIPADASNLMSIEDWHFFVHAIASGNPDQRGIGPNAATQWGGSTALPVFTSRALAMQEIHEIPKTYRKSHLRRMGQVFTVHGPGDDVAPTIPIGLTGSAPTAAEVADRYAAGDVARETVGAEPARRPSRARDTDADEWRRHDEPDVPAADGDGEGRRPLEDIGGARVQRARPEPTAQAAWLPLLDIALQEPSRPLPQDMPPPHDETVLRAVRFAAQVEHLSRLDEWRTAGDDAMKATRELADAAEQAEALMARAAGDDAATTDARVKRAGDKVRTTELAKYKGQAWQRAVKDCADDLSSHLMELLKLLSRLPFSHPDVLSALMSSASVPATVARNLAELEELALVARSAVRILGRSGRPPLLYAVTDRGRSVLRIEHTKAKPKEPVPEHMAPSTNLPNKGQAQDGRQAVPHALGVQLLLAALRRYGGTAVNLTWLTPGMKAGKLYVSDVHRKDSSVHMADLLPPGSQGLAVLNDVAGAPGTIVPDVSVQLAGNLAGETRSVDMLIEVDRTSRPSYNEEKFIGYDHFLAGWCLRLERFGPRQRNARPLVVFVCETEKAARALIDRADALMNVGIGLSGHDPETYQYFGRSHTAFTCVNWVLSGQPYALTMPPLPRSVRGQDMAWEPAVRALIPEAWWPRAPTSATRTQHRR